MCFFVFFDFVSFFAIPSVPCLFKQKIACSSIDYKRFHVRQIDELRRKARKKEKDAGLLFSFVPQIVLFNKY